MPDWATTAFFKANASNWIGQVGRMHDKMSGFLGAVKMNAERAIPGLNAMKHAFGSIAGQVAIGNLVGMGIQKVMHGVVDMVKSVPEFAERAEQIGRTSQIIGTTADNWQRLAFAAKMTDTSTEGLQGAMQKLNRNMADLTTGKGTLMDIVKYGPPGLGAMIRKTHDSTEALMLLADAFQRTHDPQVRARMAVAAFGKSGQEMIPFLIRGREGIRALMKDTPNVISDRTIAAGEAFTENLKRMRANIDGVKNTIMGTLLQAVTPFVERITTWVAANREMIAQKVTTFIDNFASGLRQARPYLEAAVRVVGWLIRNWPLLLLVYVGWTAAQIALDVALDSNPIGAIIIALEAMIAAVIIVIHYWHEITGALQAAWNWFNNLYNKSVVLRNALFFLASPVWLIVQAVRTLIDLLNGRGWKAFQNFIPPWMKWATDKMGVTDNRGGSWNDSMAPNAGASGTNINLINRVNVDNSRAPGTSSSVRVAPPLHRRPGRAVRLRGGRALSDWQARLRDHISLTAPDGSNYVAAWKGNDISGTLRVGEFNVPLVDGTIAQPMGSNSLTFPLTLYFDGVGNDTDAMAFLRKLCSSRGAWQVIHPVYGTLTLQPMGNPTLSADPTESGNVTKVETTWLETTIQTASISTSELGGATSAQVDTAMLSSGAQFTAHLNVTDTEAMAAAAATGTAGLGAFSASGLGTLIAGASDAQAAFATAYAGVQAALVAVPLDAVSAAGQVQALMQLPALVAGDIGAKITAFGDFCTRLTGQVVPGSDADSVNQAIMSELWLTGAVEGAALAITTATPATRDAAVNAITGLQALFAQVTTFLDACQTASAGNNANAQYISATGVWADLARLIGMASVYLLRLTYDLKIAKRFTLDRPRHPGEIVVSEYAPTDSADYDGLYDLFIASNNLSGNDILLLPAGREVVVYV